MKKIIFVALGLVGATITASAQFSPPMILPAGP